MQATAAPPAPDLEPVAAPRRPSAALVALAVSVALLLVVLTAARYLSLPSLALPGGLSLAALVAAAMLLAVLAPRVVHRTGRLSRPTGVEAGGLAGPTLLADPSAEPARPADLDTDELGESAWAADREVPGEPAPRAESEAHSERTLEFQVRCLEATLAEHDDLLRGALGAAAERVEEARSMEQQRVRSVLAAIRAAVADQSGEVAVNRFETALDRLGREPGVARPLLSASSHLPFSFAAPRSFCVPADPPPAAGEAAAADDPLGAAVAEEAPAEASVDGAALPAAVAPSSPDAVAAPAPLKVLPVPAPPAPAVPPRRRRGLRRSLV